MSSPARSEPSRVLTLDLWHTLAYLEPEAEEAYMRDQVELAASVLEGAPVADPPGPGRESSARRVFEEVYAEAVAASQQGRSVPPPEQIVRAGARLGRRPDPEVYLRRLRELVDRQPFLAAPGAVDVLERLREDDWRLAVISNTVGEPGASLRPMLHSLGFDRLIQTFVFSDEEPWTKPSPEIFAAALSRLGAPARSAVHVGDGWADIEGARRAGFRASVLFTGLRRYGEQYRRLFLPEGSSNPPTPYRVDRWEELPALLERLE
jgi:HAD superfamily hydrolase (TIGR01549 family)